MNGKNTILEMTLFGNLVECIDLLKRVRYIPSCYVDTLVFLTSGYPYPVHTVRYVLPVIQGPL